MKIEVANEYGCETFYSVQEMMDKITASGEGEPKTLEDCVTFYLECEYGYKITFSEE